MVPEENLNLLYGTACGAEYTDFYELARIPSPMLSPLCSLNGCAVCDVYISRDVNQSPRSRGEERTFLPANGG